MSTAGYSPPELSTEPLLANPAVDVFGVGALGVYMLTGLPLKLGVPLNVPSAPPSLSSRATLDKRERIIISQFAASTTRILSGDRLVDQGLALLLAATRSKLDRTCEAGELIGALGNLLSAIPDTIELPPRERLSAAFGGATASGLLRTEERDTWHPGMESGTGMRDFYVVTGVGYRWLRLNAGLDPPPAT